MSDWGVKIVEGLARLEERIDKRLTALESEFKEAYETLNNFTKDVVALEEDICIIKSEFSRMELENNKYKEEDEWLEGK